MGNDLIIREYKESDKFKILDLLNRNFDDQQHLNIVRDLKWWEWKYENNIFGEPIINVIEHNNKIIACRPFWPWKLNIRGKEIKCYQPVDAVVDREYRGKGAFTKLTTKTLLENKDKMDLIFNFSNEQSIRANLRLGWTYLGKLEWYVKVIKVISSYKQIKNSTGFNSLKLQSEDEINQININQVNDSIDFSGKLKTVKTKDFLIWRYLEHPQINYGMKIIESGFKQLVCVFEINENDFGRELIVVDYFGDMELFDNMLIELNVISKRYDVSFVSLLNKTGIPKQSLMKRLYIKQQRKNLVTLPLNISLDSLARDYECWDLSLGMHDSI